MRIVLTIGLILLVRIVEAQEPSVDVVNRMKQFHQSMVERNTDLSSFIDDSLSFGHSNWWIESKKDFLSNLGSRLIYHSYREDSIKVVTHRDLAHIRFVADIDVTLDGKRVTYHLRVLEVWVNKNKNWVLFARQAVR